jgi:RNA polymerase I-specific transcription initiation factor RRN7
VRRVYSGVKAQRLYLQVWGWVLWKQCYVLVHEQGFLGELWTAVRDLWRLRLGRLGDRLMGHGEGEGEGDGEDSGVRGLSPGVDSQDESESQMDVPGKKKGSGLPKLIDTICTCYMGMLLMRLPVSLSQVLHWIHEEDVPYIRAIRHVPAEMKEKLPGEYHEALDTSTVLRPEVLQKGLLRLCSLYSREYGMEISPLNSPLMLYEYVKSLSLPLEVYKTAQDLIDVLGFEFRYAESGGKRRNVLSYPEAQLMSLVVVATKLLFPFDSDASQHYSQDGNEEGILRIDWNTWMDTRTARVSVDQPNTSLKNSQLIQIRDTDVFSMSAGKLDQYMDWYQRTWARPHVADDDVNRELLEMFPLQRMADKHADEGKGLREEESKLERVRGVQANLQVSELSTEEDAAETSRPVLGHGMRYQQFRDGKALSLSTIAQAFHQEAAELSCLSIDMLLRAVLQTERKLILWRRAKRRAERFGEDMNLEVEGVILPVLGGLDQMTLAESAVDLAGRDDKEDESDESD